MIEFIACVLLPLAVLICGYAVSEGGRLGARGAGARGCCALQCCAVLCSAVQCCAVLSSPVHWRSAQKGCIARMPSSP